MHVSLLSLARRFERPNECRQDSLNFTQGVKARTDRLCAAESQITSEHELRFEFA